MNKNAKLPIRSDIFDNIDSDQKAYWLGFLWADGHLKPDSNVIRLELGEKDYAHLQSFALFIGLPLENIRYRADRNTRWLTFSDKKLADTLRRYEFKTENFDLYIPKEYILSFIRGFFDGDGSVYSQGKTSFCTSFIGLKPILEKIRMHLPGVYKKLRSVSSSTQMYRLETYGIKSSIEICKCLYETSCSTIHLLRKYNKCQYYLKLHEGTSTTKLKPSNNLDEDIV